MKEKYLKNKNLFLSILVIFLFITSFSFALFNVSLSGLNENIIKTSKVSFTYKEPINEISLSLNDALTDIEGINQNNYYEFDVKALSDSTEVLDYVIYLKETQYQNMLPKNAVKVYLTKVVNNVEQEILEPTLISDLYDYFTNNKKVLYQDSFNLNEMDIEEQVSTYRLRLWIKYDFDLSTLVTSTKTNGVTNIRLEEYKYEFKLNVSTNTI